MTDSGLANPEEDPGDASGEMPAPATAESDHRKRRYFVIGAVAVVGLVIAVAVVWWLITRNVESTDDAYIDTHIVYVSPQIAGRILHVLINDNVRVRKGQLLVEIDPADAMARFAQIKAQGAEAQAQLAQARAQIQASEATYQQAIASVAGATAQAKNAVRDLARYRGLLDTMPSAVAGEQIDQARATAVNALAQRDALENRAKASLADVDSARAQLVGAQAQVETALALLEQARLNLGYTRIFAAVAGTVATQSVAVGNYVEPGQELFAIVPFDTWVTANFKETQLSLMRPGQRVDIEIDAYPDVAFSGHVDSIERGAGEAFSLLPPENATGNYVKVVQRVPVKIMIDGPRDDRYALGPGMSVDPTVHVR